MGNWVKEVAIGVVLAILVLALLLGFDFSGLILPFSLLALGALIISSRGGLAPRFKLSSLGSGQARPVSQVTFADIGGQDVAKREFLEALTFLKESSKRKQLGIRPLKGVLLVGPPGTGKTLMAKAAASYTDSAFLTASGSEFVQMYAGVGAKRVRQLFKQAQSEAERLGKSSTIIFIDEIDVLGAKRGHNAGHMEYDQTLNELLTQMDGIKSDQSIQTLVVGATNRSDLLDPALQRPGRFDRIVPVDLPDTAGRLHILKIHAANKPLAPEVELETVARETYGFSGSHLESLLNEAAIGAMRRGQQIISGADLREAIEKVMLGEKSNRSLKDEERERVAFHEIGHAIVSETVKPGSVASITITSRNQALGYIRQNPQGDQYLYTKDQLMASIQICVAGAVMEELIFGQRSTGATGDIDQATDQAKRMIFAGLSSLGIVGSTVPETILHDTIVQIIKEQEASVKSMLESRVEVVKRIAAHLLSEESMTGDEFRSWLDKEKAS